MDTITLTAGRFSVDDLTPYWDGFEEPGKRWNGWRMPFFTEQVMLEILAYIESDPGFSEGGDAATAVKHHPVRDITERFTIAEQGEHYCPVPAVCVNGTWLWQLGGGWCWTARTDPEGESEQR